MFMSHPQMDSIVIRVIFQASPPPKTQAVSAQTSLELLSSTSPKTEKLSDQPEKDAENNESREKPNEAEGDGDVSQDPSVQQKAASGEKTPTTEDHIEESEDGTIESMESLMNKAFKGQTHLGDPTKIEKVHPDDEGEDDDDDDVETGSSSRSMMMTGLLNMALNSEMIGGLEPVDDQDGNEEDD